MIPVKLKGIAFSQTPEEILVNAGVKNSEILKTIVFDINGILRRNRKAMETRKYKCKGNKYMNNSNDKLVGGYCIQTELTMSTKKKLQKGKYIPFNSRNK